MSLSFTNYGYKLTISYTIGTVESIINKVKVQIDELKNLYKELSMDIVFSRI